MGVPQEQARKWEKEWENLRVWHWEADPEVCSVELEQGAAVPKEQQPTLQGSFPAQGKSPKSYSTKTEREKPQKGAFSQAFFQEMFWSPKCLDPWELEQLEGEK